MLNSVEEVLRGLNQRKTAFFIITAKGNVIHLDSSFILGKKTIYGLNIDTGEDVEIPFVEIAQIKEEPLH